MDDGRYAPLVGGMKEELVATMARPLLVVAVLAAYLPALRAATVDPAASMRAE